LIEALAIACFISANPSPMDWLISGPPADVTAVEDLVREESAGRLGHERKLGLDCRARKGKAH